MPSRRQRRIAKKVQRNAVFQGRQHEGLNESAEPEPSLPEPPAIQVVAETSPALDTIGVASPTHIPSTSPEPIILQEDIGKLRDLGISVYLVKQLRNGGVPHVAAVKSLGVKGLQSIGLGPIQIGKLQRTLAPHGVEIR